MDVVPTLKRWRRVADVFVTRFIAKEVTNAVARWKNGLRQEFAWLNVAFTALSLFLLWNWAFDQGLHFGLTFLIGVIAAILRGHILSHPLHLFGVGIAVAIGVELLPVLRGEIWHSMLEGELLGASVLAGAYWYFRVIKNRFETGDVGGKFVEDELYEDDFFDDDDFDDGL